MLGHRTAPVRPPARPSFSPPRTPHASAGPSLWPKDPYIKAQARILIMYCDNSFVPAMYRFMMSHKDREEVAKLREAALATWRWVDDFLMRFNPEGTLFSDADGFCMPEVAFAGFFQRYCVNEHYRHFALPEEPAYARVRRWRDAVLGSQVVRDTGSTSEEFVKLYRDYAYGTDGLAPRSNAPRSLRVPNRFALPGHGNGAKPEDREYSSFDLSVPLASRPMPPRPEF